MTNSVEIIDEQIYSLDLGFAVIGQTGPVGPQGPKGDQGNSTIGGYDISLLNITSGDVLKFGAGAWINSPEQDLIDGGNF